MVLLAVLAHFDCFNTNALDLLKRILWMSDGSLAGTL
jgi:hypothetical protein